VTVRPTSTVAYLTGGEAWYDPLARQRKQAYVWFRASENFGKLGKFISSNERSKPNKYFSFEIVGSGVRRPIFSPGICPCTLLEASLPAPLIMHALRARHASLLVKS